MNITIKREQRETCFSLPNGSNLRDEGAKSKIPERVAGLLLFTLPLLILASCVKETETSPVVTTDGETMVKFAVKAPGAASPQTRSISEGQENDVQTIDILVFQQAADGGKYVYTARCNASDITTGSDSRLKTFTIKLRQGNFDIVMLANARDLFIPSALSGLSKADALATLEATMPSGGKWPTSPYTPFPMWGDIGDITIDDNTDLTGNNKVLLTRMVARVDVGITGTAASNFRLTSVDVYNYNTTGTLVPDMLNWDDTTDPDKPYATAPNIPASSTLTEGPLQYTGTEINATDNNCIREIYLFEAENIGGGLTDRTCLVIGGIWDENGDGSFTGPTTYYRVDFSTGQGVSQAFMDVIRNHQYIFQINKVTGHGYDDSYTAFISGPFNIEAGVIHWNEHDMEDAWFDGVYYYSVSPLEKELWAAATTANEIKVKTDYPTWSYELSDLPTPGDPAADPANVDWLTVTSHTAGQDYTGAGASDIIYYDVDKNETGNLLTAYIHVTAGRFTMTATIEQNAWYIDRVYLSPTGDIPAAGDTRTVTIEGYFDHTPIRAWDITNDVLIGTEQTVPAGNNESVGLTLPALWHPDDRTQPNDITIAFEYYSTQHGEWRLIRSEDQPSYWLNISSDHVQNAAIAGGGQTYTVEAWGNFPQISLRAATNGTTNLAASTSIAAGAADQSAPATGTISVPNNGTGAARTVHLQYSLDGGVIWTTISYGSQARGNVVLSTGRVVALNDALADGTSGSATMNWATAMGIPTSYNTANYPQQNDLNYTTGYAANQGGCSSYSESGYPAGTWRLPTQAELISIYNHKAEGRIDNLEPSLYWSNTEVFENYGGYAYYVLMESGNAFSAWKAGGYYYARCVRAQ